MTFSLAYSISCFGHFVPQVSGKVSYSPPYSLEPLGDASLDFRGSKALLLYRYFSFYVRLVEVAVRPNGMAPVFGGDGELAIRQVGHLQLLYLCLRHWVIRVSV